MRRRCIWIPIKPILTSKYLRVVPVSKSNSADSALVIRIFKIESNLEIINLALSIELLHIRFLVIGWSKSKYSIGLEFADDGIHKQEGVLSDAHVPSLICAILLLLVQTNVVFVHGTLELGRTEVQASVVGSARDGV